MFANLVDWEIGFQHANCTRQLQGNRLICLYIVIYIFTSIYIVLLCTYTLYTIYLIDSQQVLRLLRFDQTKFDDNIRKSSSDIKDTPV